MPKCGLSKSLYSLDIFEWIWSHESAELRRFGAAEALRYERGLGGSVFPKDLPEAEQENLNKRLRARKNAFVD